MLYYRDNVPTKQGQARIPDRIVQQEEARGFKQRGAYLKRLRYMRDGVILGTKAQIREHLQEFRESGRYLRRKHPIAQVIGAITCIDLHQAASVAAAAPSQA